MKVSFTTYCSKEYSPLGDIVLPARRSYCERHGYELLVHDTPITGHGANWDKLVIILKALEAADVVVWNGIDVVLMNPEIRVERILEKFPRASAILATDMYGLNSDNMIFRRDGWAEQLLTAVTTLGYNLYRQHVWAEQEALIRFTSAAPYVSRVAFADQNVMNSYVNAMYARPSGWPGDYRPGDWLVHLPGLPMQQRLEAARMLAAFAQTPAARGGSAPSKAVAPCASAVAS